MYIAVLNILHGCNLGFLFHFFLISLLELNFLQVNQWFSNARRRTVYRDLLKDRGYNLADYHLTKEGTNQRENTSVYVIFLLFVIYKLPESKHNFIAR